MIAQLENSQIEDVLTHQLVGRIGCHADGITLVVPISYAYEDNSLYAHTHEGMKITMMRKNPSVCFEVDDSINTSNWRSVIVWGTFEELNEPEERTKALQILNNRTLPLHSSITMHLGPRWPFSANDLDGVDGIVFRIRLAEKTGRFERNEETPAFAF